MRNATSIERIIRQDIGTWFAPGASRRRNREPRHTYNQLQGPKHQLAKKLVVEEHEDVDSAVLDHWRMFPISCSLLLLLFGLLLDVPDATNVFDALVCLRHTPFALLVWFCLGLRVHCYGCDSDGIEDHSISVLPKPVATQWSPSTTTMLPHSFSFTVELAALVMSSLCKILYFTNTYVHTQDQTICVTSTTALSRWVARTMADITRNKSQKRKWSY
jgi:hypothetical protein